MRAVTRHALTGLLLATATVGVAANVTTMHPLVSAESRPTTASPAPITTDRASEQAEDRAAEREDRTSRSSGRKPVASSSPSAPSGPSSTAVSERRKALADQQRDRQSAAEKILQQQIEKQGYDPRTADTPREIGRQIAANKFGWTGAQWTCYDKLIVSESNWNPHATNPSSGAYGIPQSLPAGKMASEGADWRTNPATQIMWGLKYVKNSYGTPCSAWSFKQGHNWY